jgi:CheY-like chemotaxis protein
MGYAEKPTKPAGSASILVAEDDEAVGMFIEAVLVGEGYRVVQAANGEEAVRKYREQGPFNLAILDVHMPKLDGPRALKQIRAFHPAVRGMVLSGTPVEDAKSLPEWAQGFEGFLAKPFNAMELVGVVRQLLERKD